MLISFQTKNIGIQVVHYEWYRKIHNVYVLKSQFFVPGKLF